MSSNPEDIFSEAPGVDLDKAVADFELREEPETFPVEPEAPEQEAVPEPRSVDWNDVLPDDPNLPPTYRGQKTFRDLWDERVDLTHRVNRAGQLLNEKDAEVKALRATLEVIQRNVQQPQPEPTPEQRYRLAQAAGVDFDRDLITEPNEAMERFGTKVVEEAVNRSRQEMAELQNKIREREAQETINVMRNASNQARVALNIPEEQWDARLTDMMTSIYAKAADITAFQDPRWWYQAHNDVSSRWGVAPQPQQVQQQQAQPRRGPGSNTRNAGTSSSGPVIPERMRSLAQDLAKDFRIKYEDLEAEIAKDQRRR